MEFEIELKKVLSKLGMPTAFNRRTANFRKMCELKPGENISIDKVKHKAFIEVNEKGTEAAAATAVTMIKTTSMAPRRAFQMKINRPFFFTIFDSESQAILFMGTVEKP
jgi:serpin B